MQRQPRWMRLDNAAKIYPAARSRSWNNLFRLSATLKEPVDRAVLQNALEQTLPRFPSMAVRIRRGMFWYYLEEITEPPALQEEAAYPMRRMSFNDIRRCAFRVICYQNRIAVEFFHAVTDGNGALVFLKTLVAQYLTLRYGITVSPTDGVLDITEAPKDAELEDSFLKNDGPVPESRREADAFHIKGTPEADDFSNLITGILEADEVLALAHQHGVSVTVLLTAVMMMSIIELQNKRITKRRQKPVKVLLPVNLRPLFGSATLRNFALYITPGIDPRLGTYSLEEVLQLVHHQMGTLLNDKQMAARIATNVRSERSWVVRVIPLFLKNLVMKAVFYMVGERKSCLTLSNLGAVRLPEEMRDLVNRMDFILGPQATCANTCGVLSYDGKLYINFLRTIREAELEQTFFCYLRQLGLKVTIESNRR